MAPEALLEKEDEISEKTDVYAFALLFWEILSRERVFLEYDRRGDIDVCKMIYFGDCNLLSKISTFVSFHRH